MIIAEWFFAIHFEMAQFFAMTLRIAGIESYPEFETLAFLFGYINDNDLTQNIVKDGVLNA